VNPDCRGEIAVIASVGAAEIRIEYCCVADVGVVELSVTCTVKTDGFGCPLTGPEGLPVITPDWFICRPAGNAPLPDRTENLSGDTPPDTAIVWL